MPEQNLQNRILNLRLAGAFLSPDLALRSFLG